MNDIKVLIIDDDVKACERLKKHLVLKNNIKEIQCAHNIKTAEEYIDIEEFDIIALDIVMPEYDGFYFMEHINKKVYIIVMSACSEEKIIKKAFLLGAKYYIMKPYDCEIFYKRIMDVLSYEKDVLSGVFYENNREHSLY